MVAGVGSIVTGPQLGHTFEFGMTVFVTDARTPAILLISHWRPVAVVAGVAATVAIFCSTSFSRRHSITGT